MTQTSPFLRWVGGKARLVSRLANYTPVLSPKSTYYEPFLGAASLFFALEPSTAVLGDENRDLIHCYSCVQSRPDLVWRHLRPLATKQSKSEYLELRQEFNRMRDSYRKAALFIYLNKTCFNGIWRVNRKGEFNVPYGAKPKPGFPNASSLRRAASTLAVASLIPGDFEATLSGARSGDFAFLDPPYLPLNRTAFFNHYTADRFGAEQHERTAVVARQLAEAGVRVMVTEGDSEQVRDWYKDFRFHEISVRRFVSSGSEKVLARELVITSYEPPGLFR